MVVTGFSYKAKKEKESLKKGENEKKK